uniref:Uncharacterized protein n=1 Tax=Arundo donax TaxID=35708 RepID=A0A0A9FYF0_ARUDO
MCIHTAIVSGLFIEAGITILSSQFGNIGLPIELFRLFLHICHSVEDGVGASYALPLCSSGHIRKLCLLSQVECSLLFLPCLFASLRCLCSSSHCTQTHFSHY